LLEVSIKTTRVLSMAQEVTAGNILATLNKQGFVALYVDFDTNKATIKTEEGKAKNRRVEIVKK
jgi:hypothetical protein